jgi:hypothetical protein
MDWTTCSRELLDNGQDRRVSSANRKFWGRRWNARGRVGAPDLRDVTPPQAEQPKEQALLLPSSRNGLVKLGTLTLGACDAGARRG